MKHNFLKLKKSSLGRILCICVMAFLVALIIRFVFFNKGGKTTINASAVLTDSLNIAELSTAEFKYRGIASIYSDDAKTSLLCRACYNAIVKAGVDINSIVTETDTENQCIRIALPKINIKVTIIDEQSIALLPSGTDIEISQLLTSCKEDVEREATES